MHQALRPLVLARDGYRCQDCGATEMLQADHIDNHGPDTLANYQTLCRRCNIGKANRDWRAASLPPVAPHPGLVR